MHLHGLLIPTLAAVSAAAPLSDTLAKREYRGVSVEIHISIPGVPPFQSPGPVQLYRLTNFHQTGDVTELDINSPSNVNLEDVECQVYGDKQGRIPLGTLTKQGLVFESKVTVGGVLCYLV
ncbi:hypothetical protein LTR37_010948 [Vermiconidia calcicola]|uniref:Uncharacterized protein n=1 Tax=Vermiconidia calcicola TaxID=1690605 RepID=A0ACC3N3M7_9PEZI|nr:hypothetical protein LTR37_010948 [Vermiconidia calcicola]